MKDQGLSPIVCSGYRTRETQEGLYKNQVDFWLGQGYDQASAEAEAALLVARPRHQRAPAGPGGGHRLRGEPRS